MDQFIQGFKFFIDGLGTRDVDFPDSLTPQEVNLIVELLISAANTVAPQPQEGLEKLLTMLFNRVQEELGEAAAQELFRKVAS